MAAAAAQEQQARDDAESCRARWSGAVSAELPGVPAGRAWALLSDFFAIDRWIPGVASCERFDADAGAGAGSVRRVADASGERWALEELIATDAAARSLRYAVLDNSLGLRGYTATLKVAPDEEEEEEEEGEGPGGGCRIEWSFECEPGEGWSLEGLAAHLDATAKAMAERVAAAVRAEDAATATTAAEEEEVRPSLQN